MIRLNSWIAIPVDNSNDRTKPFDSFKRKLAKELYRWCEAVVITCKIVKLVDYTPTQIPTELSKAFSYLVGSSIGDKVIGYLSGLGFIRWVEIKRVGRLASKFPLSNLNIFERS